MSREIERKFLFVGSIDALISAGKVTQIRKIRQGYLTNYSDSLVVRVRQEIVTDEKSGRVDPMAFITIKKDDGMGDGLLELESRTEYALASEMLSHVNGNVIEKTRYVLDDGSEIDVFLGSLTGLKWVEIEVDSIDQEIVVPAYCGKELTGTKGISNFDLSQIPETVIKLINSLEG